MDLQSCPPLKKKKEKKKSYKYGRHKSLFHFCDRSISCTSVHCVKLNSMILLVFASPPKGGWPLRKVMFLYCMDALLHQGRLSLTRAVCLALSHSSDPDSTTVSACCCILPQPWRPRRIYQPQNYSLRPVRVTVTGCANYRPGQSSLVCLINPQKP